MSDFDIEIETILKSINQLQVNVKNGAIRAVLALTFRQLAELIEYGSEELPLTQRCKSCAHINTHNKCVYFNKPFTGYNDKVICPRLQLSPSKKEKTELNTENKITLF
ncbi:hypothetical protein EV210_12332 [Anaerospora hongkongensis]|uniref:Uncharacterized protein n=1 Tax=Anaerospora hongkongensis TaxID=244830 RepID=A0A4R1PR14_9FIRM|nr:hypothetical protein [Anaerospora hongkongensis]TCL32212.1 hypothetical protein EV210_12332 [Anaerospora hongkongensis]